MGALQGIKVVEFASIGPGPMAAMLLADRGATVLRLERPSPSGLGLDRPIHLNFLNRGRRPGVLDLKRPEGVAFALSLVCGPAIAPDEIESHRGRLARAADGIRPTRTGQIVDAATVDAATSLMSTRVRGARPARLRRYFAAFRQEGALLTRKEAA